jgi:hypothetical protein
MLLDEELGEIKQDLFKELKNRFLGTKNTNSSSSNIKTFIINYLAQRVPSDILYNIQVNISFDNKNGQYIINLINKSPTDSATFKPLPLPNDINNIKARYLL